ncbi:hypothetical protein RND81_13G068200 [Saponaria officinalis]|uniref:CID domain-containing protein n=1 Tax=Saponaria officinalis TaxID=3572 RepID=A0AAW1GUX9_SAPOF
MSNDTFDLKILSEKLSKLNSSQQSIESLSRWCVSHRRRARQVIETWEEMFKMSQKEKCVSLLYLANDILQNSRKKGNEFVNEFWKVLPAALRHVYDNCGDNGKKTATRLVDIWEERKVFGSRIQSLKDAIVTSEVKDRPQVVSNGKSGNPVKILKKDSQSLRIKLFFGDFPEKIVSAYHSLHEECSDEESTLAKCDIAVLSAERIVKDVENSISQGIQPSSSTTDEIQEQEVVLEHCVTQLERAEATRVALISLLKDALQDQEVKTRNLRDHLQVACHSINDIETLKPKISSHHSHGTPAGASTEPLMMGEHSDSMLQGTSSLHIPSCQPVDTPIVLTHPTHQPPAQPTTSFASLAANDEESKKAAAAAVAAKLAASTSSAQMLTSVLSSLMAEQAAKGSFNPMFPPEKRPKLEQQLSGPRVSRPESGSSPYYSSLQQPISSNSVGQPPLPPPLAPPLPPNNTASNQFVQSAGMMLNMPPYGFGGNGPPPPPPPPLPLSLPSHLAMGHLCPPAHQSPQPLQPPLPPSQHQNVSGGHYRPPGIGLYGSSSQSSTPPVQRHN